MKWISFLLAIAVSQIALAQNKTKAPEQKPAAAPAEQDSLDLKKLEQKYWDAKETELSVVQNRLYSKTGRYFFNANYGILMNDPYSDGRMYNFAAGYYFNERYGVELAHEGGSLKDNDSVNNYRSQYGVQADYNRFVTYTSVNFLVAPFYAKMNFLDTKILYFDIQFGVGIGQMKYESITNRGDLGAEAFGFNFDITQHFYFAEHWAVRLDVKNKFTSQERYRYQLGSLPESQRGLGKTQQQDTSILMGLTYLF